MQTIARLSDLEDYGIVSLTGEADGILGFRILCDVTERGRKILEKCYGIPGFKLAENWNSSSRSGKHVGSIMLSHDAYIDIGVFALLESGCQAVYRFFKGKEGEQSFMFSEGVLYGFGKDEDDTTMMNDWLAVANKVKWSPRRFAYSGTAGDRNTHVFSGRVT